MLEQKSGYSFTPLLLKALLYIQTVTPVPGDERSQWVTGSAQIIEADAWGNFSDTRPRQFPYMKNPPLNTQVAVTTYDEFVLQMHGTSKTKWKDAFTKEKWDTSCALIVVKADFASRPYAMLAYILCHLQYPFMDFTTKSSMYYLKWDAKGTPKWESSASEQYSSQVSNWVFVDGPVESVLIILADVDSTTWSQVGYLTLAKSFMIGNNMATTYNTKNNGPQMGSTAIKIDWAEVAALGKMTKTVFQDAMMQVIAYWEEIYNNASDRITAVKFAANFSRVWGQTKTHVPGRPNQTTGDILMGFIYDHSSDTIPAYWKPTSDYDDKTWQRAMELTTDCLGAFGTVKARENWDNYRRFVPKRAHYHVGRQNALVELCVTRSLLLFLEETPAVSLTMVPNRLVTAMARVGVWMAGASDLCFQTSDISWFERAGSRASELRLTQVESASVNKIQSEVIDGIINTVLLAGIAAPSVTSVQRSFAESQVARTAVDFFYSLPECPTLVPFSRVNHLHLQSAVADLGTYNSELSLVANINRASMSALTYQDVAANTTNPIILTVDVLNGRRSSGGGSRASELRKLTLARLPGLTSTNPYVWLYASPRVGQLFPLNYCFLAPDASLSTLVNLVRGTKGTIAYYAVGFQAVSSAYLIPEESAYVSDDFDIAIPAASDNNLRGVVSNSWSIMNTPLESRDTYGGPQPVVFGARYFNMQPSDFLGYPT